VVEAIMSARTPLALLIIAAILLAYVLLFERGRPGRTEIEARTGLLVEKLVRDRITRIRIASGDERLVLLREGEGFDETWTLLEPVEASADGELVENYMRNWEFAVPVRTLTSPSGEDLESFGLAAPKAEVAFEMGPVTTRVSLGTGAPVDGGGYVRIDGGKSVMVVGDDVVELFNQSADAFAIKNDAGAPLLDDLIDAAPGREATEATP
jgi:hypothetical protein